MSEKQVLSFDAEVGKILQLMIHSLYTNKDIFLRELISNSSDACDKLRYLALTEEGLLQGDPELKITIRSNPEQKTVTITDNGIGMNRDDLISHLGTIARSGTQGFLEQLTGDSKKDMQLIGQFGVGFYSSFMVADKVTVTSRKAGEEKAHIWASTGTGEYSIEEAEETHPRGTSITLHLREGEESYLDRFRIRHIIETYSDHINFPVFFSDEEGKEEELNTASALWTRPKAEITEEEYNQFYKHVSHSGDTPWLTLHNKNEGNIEYTNLLFIPTRKPFDLFHPDRQSRVKLYVKRVFITDEGVQLIPSYLRFLRGVVDSQDLPLNISRETLQHNHIIEKIRKSITKRVLSELKKRAEKEPETYNSFWQDFGAAIKEGLCESLEDKDKILEICRFHSLNQQKSISLEEYIASMKEGQNTIYYLTGESIEKLQNSPQLEGFKSRGIDVLLLTDSVDDFWVNVVHEYKEKEFKSVTRAGIELDKKDKASGEEDADNAAEEVTSAKEEDSAEITALIAFIKTTLGSRVKDVRTTTKLTDSPVCLAVAEGAMDIRMERFLLDQRQLASASAKVLEINPKHPIIESLAKKTASGHNGAEEGDIVQVLFDQACVIEGEPIADSGAFSRRLSSFIQKALVA